QPRRQHSPDREPRVHTLQLPEAPDHQARADQEREGDRDLENDQRAPHPVADGAARRAVASLLQRLVQAAARGEGGDQAERDPGRERNGEGEEENGRVDGDLPSAGGETRGERDEELQTAGGQEDSESASGEGDERTLRNELPGEAEPAGPERAAQGELPPPP